MIHRSRRRLATIPARRGMRAPWLRCRYPDDAREEATTETDPSGESDAVAGTAGTDAAEASPARPAEARASLEPVRPAFGHPTF